MKIQVRYFAVLRERLRMDAEALELPAGANVAAAVDALAARHDAVRTLRGKFQTAVNQEMVPASTTLADGDELVLIPPVAGARLAVEHRVGVLGIGDVAVVIAAAAPHRAEAFTACRALIDRLKERVPIWKKEIGESGDEWIGLGP